MGTLAPTAPYLVGYARVSTEDQRLDLQTDALLRAGVKPQDIHVETVSGASRKRYELDLAIKGLREGDCLVVWRLDRLARSMRDLLARLEQIEARGATFRSLTEAFDTQTAGGRFPLYVLGAVAELERQLTIERTKAGMQALRDRGHVLGAKPKLSPAQQKRIRAMLKEKREGAKDRTVWRYSMQDIAAKFNVSVSTLGNYGFKR